MKLKLTFASAVLSLVSNLSAASYYLNNVVSGGASDVLITEVNGILLDGGIVTIGYFNSSAVPSSSFADIAITMSSFHMQHSVIAGSFSPDLESAQPGYYQSSILAGADILADSPLIGRGIYLFAGDRSTLQTSSSWALVRVGTIIADNPPLINQYTANAASAFTPDNLILGSLGTYGQINTLIVGFPEPSTALLGAVGTLGFFRRRRY